jgi:hypothetical protein
MSSTEPSNTVTHESWCVSEGEKGGSAFGRRDIVGVRRSRQQMPGRRQMML